MINIGINVAAGLPMPCLHVVDELVARTRSVAAAGLRTVWLPQTYGYDALTVLAVLGREVPGVELGASVVVVQPRHPRVLAAQALTAQAATHGRLTLGLGVSHPGLLEVYDIPFAQPVRALREHLDVLLPILRGEPGPVDASVPGSGPDVPVLLGALGPVMLGLAGERTAGTITFLAGPRTIGEHVVPTIVAAAAGRAAPRVVVGLPVAVTDDPARVRAEVATEYAALAALPSYRTVLERDGFGDAGGIAIAGSEHEVVDGLHRYGDLGATDALVSLVGTAAERRRTLEVLGGLCGGQPVRTRADGAGQAG